jgi:hypothetical protein
MTDDELEKELERRAEEYARDSNVGIPWKDFDWDSAE